ncbi:hypothetical protein LTR64_008031 [Lithohypha guttulata]|uniref:uncharacterized protein n=1 Tax=Lithohypha guttulata TaxID=1690604 RepID=UPI002DDFD1F1|nr:hypothetical protein LTR51_008100 [Lithohypha guttulata]
MGKQPAAIIIVRLDQADTSWRATADFPWDSPLTYGGWIQCQTLGARIDKELQLIANQISPDDLSWEEDGVSVERPKKKRRIIIHTSPYKRCIQTSIAIAAGLKYPQPEHVRPVLNPHQTANTATNKPESVPATSNGNGVHSMPANTFQGNIEKDKIALKVDPWLSEWLSTGYFEEDGPPPPSEKIVERAKETLTRPIEEIRGADLSAFLPIPETPDPDDADKENELKQTLQEKGGLRAMAAAGHALPHRNRTISFNFEKGSLRSQLGQKLRQRARTSVVYSPPVPQYALAPQDSIPAGYVAHARDACVSSDLNWDSIAMGWGDAGTYPEEWSAMHVRFRVGLQKMLVYYQDDYQAHGGEEDQDNIGDDVILVLVTHQAGANALIRLVTGAPALHDFGGLSYIDYPHWQELAIHHSATIESQDEILVAGRSTSASPTTLKCALLPQQTTYATDPIHSASIRHVFDRVLLLQLAKVLAATTSMVSLLEIHWLGARIPLPIPHELYLHADEPAIPRDQP